MSEPTLYCKCHFFASVLNHQCILNEYKKQFKTVFMVCGNKLANDLLSKERQPVYGHINPKLCTAHIIK